MAKGDGKGSGGKGGGGKGSDAGAGNGSGNHSAGLRGLLRVAPGSGPVALKTYDPASTPGGPPDKAAARAEEPDTRERLVDLQERLFAQSTAGDPRCVLLVLQGMDTSGKGGTLKHVTAGLNPAGVRVKAFKAPTEEELEHPFLWRVRRALPAPGEIGVFDRSHYEDVLIARVRELVPRETWSGRYDVINNFEQSLADDGVTVVKVFLHISYEKQRDRLLARLDKPDKHWKFNAGDIEERALWPAYQQAYEAVLERCSTDAAPWYVVPADHKWYRNWAVRTLVLEHLELIGPTFPAADFDVAASRARLLAT